MNTKNDGGPAFPTVEHYDDGVVAGEYHGMSLRDWFAGQALAGWMASFPPDAGVKPAKCANFAYELADAMIAARDAK